MGKTYTEIWGGGEMRKIIYNVCLLLGSVIGSLGISVSNSSASVPVTDNEKLAQKVSTATLNFSDIITENSENLQAYHYSHSSHGSHGSHGSHRSHYSSRF